MPNDPTRTLQRRSMLDRWHRRHGAELVEHDGSLMVAKYASAADEDQAARKLGLCDLSTMPRTGVTGSGATDWLATQGLSVPDAPNRAVRQADGDVLLRLSGSEYLLLATRLLASGGSPDGFRALSDRPDQRVYALPRLDSHCCFAITGAFAAELLSLVCPVDLGPQVFANGHVAQTEMIHLSAIVLRHDLHRFPCYLVLVNSVAAEYAHEAILDAMAQLNGTPVGLHALQSGGL